MPYPIGQALRLHNYAECNGAVAPSRVAISALGRTGVLLDLHVPFEGDASHDRGEEAGYMINVRLSRFRTVAARRLRRSLK